MFALVFRLEIVVGLLGGGSRYSHAELAFLLREATGLDNVHGEKQRPGMGASVAVMVDEEINTRCTQRLSLQSRDQGLALCTWPAELVDQAKATYRTNRSNRAQRLLGFLADPGPWRVRQNVHLAYRRADIYQRLYLDCHLEAAEYIDRWLGRDFDYVRLYSWDQVSEDLWPWLLERQYATSVDEPGLSRFLADLKHRDAYLRPGIQLKRVWPWDHIVAPGSYGALVREIRAAVAEVLTMLDEPLPPACASPAASTGRT
jgi:hypothetical protein